MLRSSTLLFLVTLLTQCASASGDSPSHVIVVSRHGVRTPFSPTGGDLETNTFQPYSKHWQEFPVTKESWGVPSIKGQLLTDHGKVVITRMGSYFNTYYNALLSTQDCKDYFFYADDCTRDLQTATAFFKGLSNKCAESGGIDQISTEGAKTLFNQGAVQTEQCGLPPKEEINALVGGSANNYQAYKSAHTTFVSNVQDVIACCSNTKLCKHNGAQPCTLSDITMQYTGQYYAAINGSVYLSGYFASYFMLAALNNMTLGLPSNPRKLSQVTDWYHWSSSTLNVVDGASSSPSFASTLASHVLASLQQASTGEQVDGLLHTPATKLIYMAGHDTNLVLLRTLLDLTWLANGWRRDDPSPGGMLLFELYDNGIGGHDVEIVFQVATPTQIRNAEILSESNPPSRTPVLLPGCRTLRCPLTNFTSIVLDAIKQECVGLPKLQSYVHTLAAAAAAAAAPTNAGHLTAPAWEFIVAAVGLVCITAAIVVPLTLFFTRRKQRLSSESYLLGK